MKSYLSLIQLSAKVRRRQNRMTVLCIVFAVFLVTAIFSLADMMIRSESGLMLAKHGNWHLSLTGITPETAEQIAQRPDITAVGSASVYNLDASLPYRINEKRAGLCGVDETYLTLLFDGVSDGSFPRSDTEVMLSPNAAIALHVELGDEVTVHTPAGDSVFTVSGFGTDDPDYYNNQTFLVVVYLTPSAFAYLMEQNAVTDTAPTYYLQFESAAMAAKAKPELISQYQLPESSVSENKGVMGMAGQSSSETMNGVYDIAVVLFVLVLLAGVLMISGSMNSNVAQRTQFFGMLRCIGASRAQIIRFVRLEALSWCKTAVPLGLVLGTLITWVLCAALRYGIGGEFAAVPLCKLSPVGLVSGAVVGVVTVLLAAQSPARRASKVSPVSAVSGGAENTAVRRGMKLRVGKIDRSLGVHHAVAKKKNWFLMTASFALTIILVFAFSVLLDFARLLLPAMRVTSADLALNSYSNALNLDRSLVDSIRGIDGVSAAYGCCYLDGIPASSSRTGINHVNVVSYDDVLLDYAQGNVVRGTLDGVYGDSNQVATVYNKNNALQVGDKVQFAGSELEVTCALSQGLFGDDLIIICSQPTFDRLMGAENYGLIGVQLSPRATDETISRILSLETDDTIIIDLRSDNATDASTYWASRIVCYGFLSIIGLISLFNIINSISMSVSARIRQYGAMRAVGMDVGQLTRMISAEAMTYALSGLLLGCGLGLPFGRFLHELLITRQMGIAWQLPVVWIAIVIVYMLLSVFIAVRSPVRRIRSLAITDTINEL